MRNEVFVLNFGNFDYKEIILDIAPGKIEQLQNLDRAIVIPSTENSFIVTDVETIAMEFPNEKAKEVVKNAIRKMHFIVYPEDLPEIFSKISAIQIRENGKTYHPFGEIELYNTDFGPFFGGPKGVMILKPKEEIDELYVDEVRWEPDGVEVTFGLISDTIPFEKVPKVKRVYYRDGDPPKNIKGIFDAEEVFQL